METIKFIFTVIGIGTLCVLFGMLCYCLYNMVSREKKIKELETKLVCYNWIVNGNLSHLYSWSSIDFYKKEMKKIEQQLKKLEK